MFRYLTLSVGTTLARRGLVLRTRANLEPEARQGIGLHRELQGGDLGRSHVMDLEDRAVQGARDPQAPSVRRFYIFSSYFLR
jgi:hypothetical protein